MTTYIDGKAVGVGTIRAEIGVTGVVLHDNTLVGNGNTEPLGVNTENIVSQQTLANTISVLNTAIDAQAEAIAKTRNDFEVADQNVRADMNAKDSELETILNDHAERLATLRTDHDDLGDDVSDIQAKIPQSASGSNPLITKQQLLDKEMDIRSDLIDIQGELQTQITAQAGAIAGKQDELTAGEGIKIENNVISATGGGTGGDYLPLSGGTVSGDAAVKGTFKVGAAIFKEQYNILNITPWSGMSYYQLSSSYFRGTGSEQTLGGGGSFWKNVYTKKLNNGADITIPTSGGTMVVATPPTEDGSYVLKCVITDGIPAVSWAKE